MAAGVELAAGVAGQHSSAADKSVANKMVLIADGLDPVDDRSLPHLRELLHKTIDAGVKWEMIGLGQDATFSPQWDELAAIGGHRVRHAGTPDELFQRLYETLAGRSQIVAASVDMKVTFVPEAVSRYRLIGHEANGDGGLSGASLQKDLRSGQSATALYEVELKPDGPAEVAFVEVSWRDPGGRRAAAYPPADRPIAILEFLARMCFAVANRGPRGGDGRSAPQLECLADHVARARPGGRSCGRSKPGPGQASRHHPAQATHRASPHRQASPTRQRPRRLVTLFSHSTFVIRHSHPAGYLFFRNFGLRSGMGALTFSE